MPSSFSFKDQETGWNNPNKTKKQKQLLSFRGKVLNQRMAYPLDYKIMLAKRRIKSAIMNYGKDNCYLSFSGGKDSTILSHLVLSLGYKLEHVFSNTRLEYKECVTFSKEWCKQNGVKLIEVKPDIRPEEIWKTYGYPMFSKEVATILDRMRRAKKVNPKKIKKVIAFLERLGYKGRLRNQDKSMYKRINVKKIKDFLNSNEIRISAQCCDLLKKKPMKKWQKENDKKVAIMGVRAQESLMRRTVWVRKGCIYETKDQVVVNPIIFFTDKDIWEYAKKFNIKFADIYYEPHNLERNGCYCCGFGCHRTEENNFIKLKEMNPHLWASVTNHWGFSEICKKCGVDIE